MKINVRQKYTNFLPYADIIIKIDGCKLTKSITNKTEAEKLAKELLAASLTLRAIYEINLEQRNEKDPHYLQT